MYSPKYIIIIFILATQVFLFIHVFSALIALYSIFKKEEIDPHKALIPFYNFYILFKICNIPYYTLFIPLINVIVLACVPYILAKQYKLKKWLGVISFLFPFVTYSYIAFSAVKKEKQPSILSFSKDIDNIEKKNILNSQYANAEINDFAFNDEKEAKKDNSFLNLTEEKINKMDNPEQIDDFFFDNIEMQSPTDTKTNEFNNTKAISDDELFDIVDEDIENLRVSSNVDKLEDNLTNDKKVFVENAKYNEYKLDGPSVEAIAFGGLEKKENIVSAKKETLKCDRCGSSLIGANGYCPGCGKAISDMQNK